MQYIDLTGYRSGKLEVKGPTPERRSGSVVWEISCDCGKTVFWVSRKLRGLNPRTNCGCEEQVRTISNSWGRPKRKPTPNPNPNIVDHDVSLGRLFDRYMKTAIGSPAAFEILESIRARCGPHSG